MDGFINFAIGSSEFANDLNIYGTLIEPFRLLRALPSCSACSHKNILQF